MEWWRQASTPDPSPLSRVDLARAAFGLDLRVGAASERRGNNLTAVGEFPASTIHIPASTNIPASTTIRREVAHIREHATLINILRLSEAMQPQRLALLECTMRRNTAPLRQIVS